MQEIQAWCSKKAISMNIKEIPPTLNYDEVPLTDFDSVLISAYSGLDQRALGHFLNACVLNGITVVLVGACNVS